MSGRPSKRPYYAQFTFRFVSGQRGLQVLGSEQETSRLLLAEATAATMRTCFHLLGITALYRI